MAIGDLFRFLGRSLRSLGSVVRHIRKSGQPVTFLDILAILRQFLPRDSFPTRTWNYTWRGLSPGRDGPLFPDGPQISGYRGHGGGYRGTVDLRRGGRKDIPISKAIQASTAIPVF